MNEPRKPYVGPAARIARTGGYKLPTAQSASVNDASASLLNTAAALRSALDSAQTCELLTPAERRARSVAAVTEAKRAFGAIVAKMSSATAAVGATVENLQGLLRQVESNYSPLGVRRLEIRAAALRGLDIDVLGNLRQKAIARRDVGELLAHSLADAEPGPALRDVLRVARPESLAAVREDAAVLHELRRAVGRFAAGLDELDSVPDAHEVGHATSEDLFTIANGAQVHGEPATELPATWPQWLFEGEVAS